MPRPSPLFTGTSSRAGRASVSPCSFQVRATLPLAAISTASASARSCQQNAKPTCRKRYNHDHRANREGQVKDGGAAFPIQPQIGPNKEGTWFLMTSSPGMSLRDYFAAAAMQAYRNGRFAEESEVIARFAYADADAM